MENSGAGKGSAETDHQVDYDRAKELKAFDDTKAGVKGLVDAGVVNVPKIFIRPADELTEEIQYCRPLQTSLHVPIVDLKGLGGDRHKEIVDEVRVASETWGFLQVVNHGIPISVLEGMIEGIRKFNEEDLEVKKEFYTRDRTNRKVRFACNYDLYHSRSANWRDTLTINMLDSKVFDPKGFPAACRDQTIEYIGHVRKLGDILFELLSEALGLETDHLIGMECGKECTFICHYYPACPEPELTLGSAKHSDPVFITILLQDQIGGLQVLHKNQWVDVHPISGGLVVNIGDFLQILSNDRFKSVKHRVLANHVGPRVSVACFMVGNTTAPPKPYGPIRELISEENPPLYGDFSSREYIGKFLLQGLDEKSCVDNFKL